MEAKEVTSFTNGPLAHQIKTLSCQLLEEKILRTLQIYYIFRTKFHTCSGFSKNADFIIGLHSKSSESSSKVVSTGISIFITDPPVESNITSVKQVLKNKKRVGVEG